MSSRIGFVSALAVLSLSACTSNSPPVAPTIHLEPENVFTGKDLRLVVDEPASDPDPEDWVEVSIAWSVDGEVRDDLAGEEMVPSGLTSKHQTWRVEVTGTDGELSFEPVSAEKTILNSGVRVDSLELQPTDPRTNDTVTAVYSVFDRDEDEITVRKRFSVNGEMVQNGPDDTLSGEYFELGDEIVVEIRGNDGEGPGDWVTSDPVTVINTPPTQPTVVLEPQTPRPDRDDLVCTIEDPSYDADGHEITYDFSFVQDGTAYSGSIDTTSYEGDTVPARRIGGEEEWMCTATPFDGYEYGEPSDSQVVTSDLGEYPLDELCGNTTNGVYCGGNCTGNTEQFADAYCQIGGYSEAASYTEITSGSVGPTWYYNSSSVGSVPDACDDLRWTTSYNARTYCTCLRDLVCE